jgi:DNA modification methylase
MQIKKVDINLLENWDKNPRGIKEKDFNRLKEQIKKLGVYKPLIACKENEKYIILGGNMRLRAYRELGHKEVYITEVEAKTDKIKTEIALSDNDSVGYYEYDKLYELLEPLKDNFDFGDFKVDIEGLKNISLESIFNDMETKEVEGEDDVTEIKKTNIKLGDMFELGEHRLLCGDSTKKADVERLMQGEKADMVFTDPPYGVDYGAKNRFLNSFQKAGRNLKDVANDMLGKDELLDFLVKAFTLAYEYGADHCSYYVTGPQGGELGLMMMMMMMSGLPTRHVLIWNKNRQNFSLGRLDYEYKHEPILFTWKKTHKFYGGGECQSSVWDVDKEMKCDKHPTMKPIALMVNALLNSSQRGEICLDLFGGSGSTLIACEKTERKCRMIELDPQYCQVIIDRWEKFTDKKAKQIDN